MSTPRPREGGAPLDVPIRSTDVRRLLMAIETAYEAAVMLADEGQIDFAPFTGLGDAIATARGFLSAERDHVSRAGDGR